MLKAKPVGQGAAARKYDILTAIGAHAMAGDSSKQRIALRLITLITARYNWSRDELVVGRREMARLWCVTERTVKREMALLKGLGWVEVKRPAARARITAYRIRFDIILGDTRPAWMNVGEDFHDRLVETPEPPAAAERRVVPFPSRGEGATVAQAGAAGWEAALSILQTTNPHVYSAWIRPLQAVSQTGGLMVLTAPSRFHAHYVSQHLTTAIIQALRRADPTFTDVVITSD
ncbi:DnaA N-terminal domain-containing protein [Pseudooceanicola sp.]|uniref:DnaA N-terminal domain-containing protein n=1 Tax=Pseudooceanicola sp. TaxID=1914328 RepID=UPI00261A0881|nr:DnaA N-terminal domain-containing protein [Pseudooceanicola sp.]MDF1856487.1 DnaA N-terminal domain-containing protein [Pseudooceanicola sp.]